MAFVGREQELALLRDWWAHDSERPALVWGRRRVGKTALIQRFAEDLPRVVFHTGVGEPAAAELAALSRQAATVLPTDLRDLEATPYRDWEDLLDHLARAAQEQPILLVLDEFPELIATSPALPGILRAFLDRTMGRTRLRLLLCGSAVRTMWSIQQTRAPLYGRFNLALPVHPFRPHEASLLLPGLSPVDRARVFGIVGGMPLYLTWWRQEMSVTDNVARLACRPGSPLLTEGRLIMLTEVGADHAAATLYAIAAGKTRHHEIEDTIGADPSRVLERLLEARLIERVIPVTDDPQRSRRRIYRIADNFLAFYLGPLLRYRSEIERGHGENVLPALLKRLDEHMGPAYEEAFRDHLWRLAARGDLGEGVVAIGPWWRKDGQDQIDAVALAEPDRTRVPVLVGESKWGRRIDARRITAKLHAKALGLTDDVESLRYAVCGHEEIINADPDTLTVTAEDIFSPGG
ncbi:ATP-binding protein [Actinoallomurus spadix]|uniref:ATP-binding protein n=1 Tax=Actinoallomurus spadix TaxID=79912 RepID=A0ABN0WE89_9ACTN